MTDPPKGDEDMNDLEAARSAIRHGLRLIAGFVLTDPTLWPIMSEVEMALRRGLPGGDRS